MFFENGEYARRAMEPKEDQVNFIRVHHTDVHGGSDQIF
jgi:hypothetical protein